MDKKKIPASAYMIIGAAMILMSVFINIEKLAVFILFGAIFIVVGFLKILLREKKAAKHIHRQHVAHKPAHPHKPAAHKPHKPHPKHPVHHKAPEHVVRCSSCGVKLHHMFKFCPNCGQKLK